MIWPRQLYHMPIAGEQLRLRECILSLAQRVQIGRTFHLNSKKASTTEVNSTDTTGSTDMTGEMGGSITGSTITVGEHLTNNHSEGTWATHGAAILIIDILIEDGITGTRMVSMLPLVLRLWTTWAVTELSQTRTKHLKIGIQTIPLLRYLTTPHQRRHLTTVLVLKLSSRLRHYTMGRPGQVQNIQNGQ